MKQAAVLKLVPKAEPVNPFQREEREACKHPLQAITTNFGGQRVCSACLTALEDKCNGTSGCSSQPQSTGGFRS